MNSTTALDMAPVTVTALYVGRVAPFGAADATSAIVKRAVNDARRIDAGGVAGDAQADRKRHGGPDRALNHYPAEHYAHWRARYPGFDAALQAGAFGENVSTDGLTEAEVCVGDVFALGSAVLQITQPRQPCWKVEARTGIAGLTRALTHTGHTGWLYRVLEPGEIAAGEPLTRVERAGHGITLAELWQALLARRPDPEQRALMRTLSARPELAPEWRDRLGRRA